MDATLADYVKTEGATLANATIGSGSIADTVMLGDSISVGGLKSSLSENTSAISSLKSTVGDANSGLVKDVKDNKNSIDVLTTTVVRCKQRSGKRCKGQQSRHLIVKVQGRR